MCQNSYYNPEKRFSREIFRQPVLAKMLQHAMHVCTRSIHSCAMLVGITLPVQPVMAHSHCTGPGTGTGQGTGCTVHIAPGLGQGQGMMALYIMLCTVHITQGQGMGQGIAKPIAQYRTSYRSEW